MPPPAPSSSGGGLNLKKLPPWAWVVAIVGGVVVGFVLLKPGRGGAELEEGELGDEQAPAKKSGGGGAPPLPRDAIEALGLSPGEYQFPTFGDGGFESSSDGFVESSAESSAAGVETSLASAVRQAGIIPQAPTTYYAVPSSVPGYSSSLPSTAYTVPASVPGYSAPSGGDSGGAGSRTNLAQ